MNDNWLQHNNLLIKYLERLSTNPYIEELREYYDNLKIKRFLRNFNTEYTKWLVNLISSNIITNEFVDKINNLFDSEVLLGVFKTYIVENYKTQDKLMDFFTNKSDVDLIFRKIKNTLPETEFNPTKLKFVTTTAIAWIVNPKEEININFKEIYNKINIDDDVLLVKKASIYKEEYIGKIVGCKTGGEKIKGYFKKKNLGDFYNCTTANVLISQIKSVNVKIFNNGKLQMTGISKPSDGEKAVDYICNMINNLTSNKHNIITNKTNYKVSRFSYKTVMINTCYELGICINREILYNILSKQYKLNTIYDADGYPGVRVEYYYNTLTTNTQFEGICNCSQKCRGKGVGEGDNNCRKISIAIFQSGSTIIAGGCNCITPIERTYTFINNIIKTIINSIKKNDTEANKLKRHRARVVFIDKNKIINNKYLNKILEFNV